MDGNGPLPFCHTFMIGKNLMLVQVRYDAPWRHVSLSFFLSFGSLLSLFCVLCFVFCDHLDGWETEREGRGTQRGAVERCNQTQHKK